MARSAEEIRRELSRVREELEDRRRALPAHSLRPWQFAAIEELEDRERELLRELSLTE
jgi:hypothetical protein